MDGNTSSNDPFGPSPMSQVYGPKNPERKQEYGSPKPSPTGNQHHGSGKKDFIKKSLVFIWEFIKIALVAAIIILPIRYFLFQPFIVKGDSMVPNLQSGDYLIVDEISYRFSEPSRGDIVVLKYPFDPAQRFIKRVIGLPGETVKIKNGKVDITKDGKEIVLDEKNYLPDLNNTEGDVAITLKDNDYFVLGDNREFSYDSRRWGVLPKEDIVGKAVFRVFPFKNMSYLATPTY